MAGSLHRLVKNIIYYFAHRKSEEQWPRTFSRAFSNESSVLNVCIIYFHNINNWSTSAESDMGGHFCKIDTQTLVITNSSQSANKKHLW